MFKKKLLITILSVILLYSLSFSSVYALSCAEPLSVEESFKNYEGVIVGEVLSVKEKSNEKLLTVKVIDTLKEINEEEINIKEDKMWGESIEGKTYVFYLNKDGLNQWSNPLCSPTSGLESNIDEAKDYFLISTSTIKENMQETQPNERVDESIDNNSVEKISKETIEENSNKEVIILVILSISLLIALFIYFKNKNKNK